jgi:hypothetical protein
MLLSEYQALDTFNKSIAVSDLTDQTPRTLLYGYTTDRATFHVYLDYDGLLHLRTYDSGTDKDAVHQAKSAFNPHDLVPSKRVYPEASDAEFCRLLILRGVNVPFTVFNSGRAPAQFHGTISV